MNILEWIDKRLDMTLFPAQKFVLKLAYDLPLSEDERIRFEHPFGDKYDFNEREYLNFLTRDGRCNYTDRASSRSFFMSIGRRAGKTTFSGLVTANAVRELIEMDNPHERFGIPTGSCIAVSAFGMSLDQAKIIHKELSSVFARDDILADHLVRETAVGFEFATPHARRTRDKGFSNIRVRTKSSSAKGLRGYANYMLTFDEYAHFTHPREVWTAGIPSLACFSPKGSDRMPVGPVEGRLFVASSPNGYNDFYEQWASTYNSSVLIPTWEMNPTVPREYFHAKFEEDPARFWVEHGARFSSLRY